MRCMIIIGNGERGEQMSEEEKVRAKKPLPIMAAICELFLLLLPSLPALGQLRCPRSCCKNCSRNSSKSSRYIEGFTLLCTHSRTFLRTGPREHEAKELCPRWLVTLNRQKTGRSRRPASQRTDSALIQ